MTAVEVTVCFSYYEWEAVLPVFKTIHVDFLLLAALLGGLLVPDLSSHAFQRSLFSLTNKNAINALHQISPSDSRLRNMLENELHKSGSK